MPYPGNIGPIDPSEVPAKGYDLILSEVSDLAQNPTGVDTPTQITYGAGGTSSDGSITLASDGNLTFNETGFYALKARYRFGRDGAAGVSNLFNWVEISVDGGNNWDVIGNAIDVTLRNSSEVNIFFDLSILEFQQGVMLRAMFARSSTGSDFGGLIPSPISAPLSALGIPDAPSAQLTVYRIAPQDS